MDGRKQPDFAAALDVKSSDLPTVSVLSPHKRRYATLKGVYSQDSMVKLLDGVVSSKTKTHTIQDIPLVHDGGVEVLEEDVIEEEEFDLSDIMGEEVEEIVTSEQKLKELDEQLRRQQEEAAAEAAKAKKTKGKGKGKGKKNKSKSKSKKDEL